MKMYVSLNLVYAMWFYNEFMNIVIVHQVGEHFQITTNRI